MDGMNRCGQPSKAIYHKGISSNGGEEQRAEKAGMPFYCGMVQSTRHSKTFQSGIEGKSVSVVIFSTDTVVLKDIEKYGGKIDYMNARHAISFAEFDPFKRIYTIALE